MHMVGFPHDAKNFLMTWDGQILHSFLCYLTLLLAIQKENSTPVY